MEAYDDEKFHEWLFKNYLVGNGEQMIELIEDGITYEIYLKETGQYERL